MREIHEFEVECLVETIIERNNSQGPEAAKKVAVKMFSIMGIKVVEEDE